MKKRTLGFKLTFGGIMLVLVPIVVIGGFALYKATGALEDMARGQAVQIAKNISDMIEVALKEEMKVASHLAVQPYVIEAASKSSKDGAGKASGELERLSTEFAKVMKHSGSDYESVFVADAGGTIIADGSNGKTVMRCHVCHRVEVKRLCRTAEMRVKEISIPLTYHSLNDYSHLLLLHLIVYCLKIDS